MLAAPSACTPMTWQEGFSSFTALATPEISPPPPMAVMITSTSGSCCKISRPMVPCPAMML